MPFPNAGLTSKDLCNGAAIERVLGDESVTSVKIAAHLQSDNFSTGSAGWKINRDTGSAEFNDILVRGDIESSNWNGTSPANLASVDGGATAGFYLDSSVGSAQFEGDIFLGGDLTLEGGTIRSAGSGKRVELTVPGTYASLDFYSGDGSETNNGYLRAAASGGDGFMYLSPPEISGGDSTLFVSADTFISLAAGTGDASVGIATAGVTLQGGDSGDIKFVITNGAGQILIHDTASTSVDGSASAPVISFFNDPDTGIYRVGANRFGFTLGGTHVAEFNGGKLRTATAATGSPEILFGSSTGDATNPVYSFQGDSNTGMFRSASDVLAWTTGGTTRMTLSNTEHTLAAGLDYLGQPSTTGSAANASWQVASGSVYKLQRSTSARKYKRDIDYDTGFLADYELKPAVFYRPDDDAWFIDFIADDLAEQDNRMGVYEGGEVENYHKPSVMAVLAAKVNRLEQEAQAWKNATSR